GNAPPPPRSPGWSAGTCADRSNLASTPASGVGASGRNRDSGHEPALHPGERGGAKTPSRIPHGPTGVLSHSPATGHGLANTPSSSRLKNWKSRTSHSTKF